MIIAVAGAYSANTEAEKQRNIDVLNEAAARLLEKGHIPLIGVNAALPVVVKANLENKYKAIMDISVAVIGCCEALLMVSESAGAIRERDFILAKGLPVYYSIDDVAEAIES
jgi:hypothetical protein